MLVQGVGLGIEGSAIANVVAQVASGATFVILLIRRGAPLAPEPRAHPRADAGRARPRAAHGVRSSRPSRLRRRSPPAWATRSSPRTRSGSSCGSSSRSPLDSIAIAAQTLVGSLLGAGDVDAAWVLGRRLLRFGALFGVAVAVLLAAGYDVIPRLFTSDQAVRDQVAILWPWFVAMLPFCGVLFALDGVLLGAGDLVVHAQRHGRRGPRRVPAAGAGRLRRRPRDSEASGPRSQPSSGSGSPSGSCTGAGAPGSCPARSPSTACRRPGRTEDFGTPSRRVPGSPLDGLLAFAIITTRLALPGRECQSIANPAGGEPHEPEAPGRPHHR